MLRRIRNGVLSAVIAFTAAFPVQAGSIDGTAGKYFFRHKTTASPAVDDPDKQAKDVTVYYVGGVNFEFDELLPLKPEWQDDHWKITSGTLPEGISFNSATRKFVGKPKAAAKDVVVFLSGIDINGNEVADAKATFDIYDIEGTPVKTDITAHTGKYTLDELAVPSGVTIDTWERLYALPPGI